MKNCDSVKNQEIKGGFVAREIRGCFSYEMEAILRAGTNNTKDKDYPLPDYDEIENLFEYVCPDCGAGYREEKDFCRRRMKKK